MSTLIGVSTVVRGIGVTLTPTPFRDNLGDQHLLFTGERAGSQILSTPAGWTLQSADTNAKQEKMFQFDNTTGNNTTTIPGITWGSGSIAYAYIETWTGLAPAATALDVSGDRVANVTSGNIIGSASSKTPSGPGVAFLFGGFNKTSASDTSTYTKPSGWDALGVNDVLNGSNTVAIACAHWIQSTPTTIVANVAITASIADVSSNMQGSFVFLKAAGAALAGAAAAGASASGDLNRLAGGAAASAAAAAALTTAIRMAAAASAGTSASSSLTNWTTVTLASTQYTGVGGLHDPALIAQGWDPPVGTTISYDAQYATCYANAEISSITNNCSFVAQYNDGTTWRVAIIVITPQMVSTSTISAAVAGALTTAVRMAAGAISIATSTGQLATAILLSGSAASIANAAAALSTGIQLGGSASAASSSQGALSGGQASLQGTASTLSTALGTLTAKIQFAGAIVADSVVAGAIATKIQLSGAAAALTNAAADIQVAIRLSGDANVQTSAAGSALITSSLSSAANAVSSATGALFTAFRLAGNAFVGSTGSGDLSTGISLAGAAEADTSASIRPVGSEGQFGRADINVLSPTGYPTALAVFIEGSSTIVTISYFNSKGLPFVPLRVQWRVLDLTSGIEIIPYTEIADVELSNAITIPGASNTIINQARDSEQHEVLFKITDTLGTVNYARALFELLSQSTGLN